MRQRGLVFRNTSRLLISSLFFASLFSAPVLAATSLSGLTATPNSNPGSYSVTLNWQGLTDLGWQVWEGTSEVAGISDPTQTSYTVPVSCGTPYTFSVYPIDVLSALGDPLSTSVTVPCAAPPSVTVTTPAGSVSTSTNGSSTSVSGSSPMVPASGLSAESAGSSAASSPAAPAVSQASNSTAPTKPTDFTAVATAPTVVTLTWNAGNNDEKYVLNRSTDNNHWQPIAVTNTTAFVDHNVAYNTTYWYQLIAKNIAGEQAPPITTRVKSAPPQSFANKIPILRLLTPPAEPPRSIAIPAGTLVPIVIAILLVIIILAAIVRRWYAYGLLRKELMQERVQLMAVAAAEFDYAMVQAAKACTHLGLVQPVKPSSLGCLECSKEHYTDWKSLRICLVCGHVGCSDSSPRQHARQHFRETGHPIVYSFKNPAGDHGGWCYVDRTVIEPGDWRLTEV